MHTASLKLHCFPLRVPQSRYAGEAWSGGISGKALESTVNPNSGSRESMGQMLLKGNSLISFTFAASGPSRTDCAWCMFVLTHGRMND